MSPTYRALMAASVCAVTVSMLALAPANASLPSTTVSPAGAKVRAVNVGAVSITVAGFATATCTSVSATGTVPKAPANHNPSGPVSVSIAAPTASGCGINIPFESVTLTASGTWEVSGQYGSTLTGSLTIPQNGAIAQLSGVTNCTARVAPNGPVTLSAAGTWTNGTGGVNPSTAAVVNAPVQASVTGGFGCPSGLQTGTLNAKFALVNITNSALPITVGP